MSARLHIQPDPEPIGCTYRERAAMFEASKLLWLDKPELHRAIAHLILAAGKDVNRVAMRAHLAARNVGEAN